MLKNEGKKDRVARLLIGLILVYLGYTVSAWIYILALISLITSFTGYCALYQLLGINTNNKKRR